MAASLSRSQIERLGSRLVGKTEPAEEDLELLRQLLLARSDTLDRAEARVRRELDIKPTSRVKNTETIREKLRRSGGSGLKSMQDLAGMRIVGDFGRMGQDQQVEQLVALFAECERFPKTVDRRAEPMHGYRAVHVIVFPDDVPVEIQVRTELQHEWAEFFEKLADLMGRGIRYGDAPIRWEPLPGDGEPVREALSRRNELIDALVDSALELATVIAAVEVREVAAPGDPNVEGFRRFVNDDLEEMRQDLRRVEAGDETIKRLRQ
jgi:ppGpp synthetase/RelA/SpoT-type nucleotidyltranferase